jgi:LDH2 family malate/lactate/ureidoglycolate dehydrogenase
MRDGSNYLDPDRPGTVRLSVGDARALGEASLGRIGYGGDDARIITDQLIDNALCGYGFAGLPRILAIAREARTKNARVPVAVVHETPVSALVDGGNNVGYVAVYRGAEIAIAKAKQTGIVVVGVYNSYFSGRNAYYLERIVDAGLVGLHTASGSPHIVPPGATRPALGTNPIAFGFPSAEGPVIFGHRHGIADVGRGIACRRNRRSIAAGRSLRRRWEPHRRRSRGGTGRCRRFWRT